jgi:uncharacterized protein
MPPNTFTKNFFQAQTPRGISIPFRFDATGYPAPDIGLAQTIQDSIYTILSTTVGERVHRPTFGCFLKSIIFEPLSKATALRAMSEVRRAVGLWEPRASITNIEFELEDTKIILRISWIANGAIQGATDIPITISGG